MSNGYDVDVEQLTTFAANAADRQATLSSSTCTLPAAEVGHDSFGRIPVVADRIRGAYEDHVRGCVEAVRTAVEVAGAIAAATQRLRDNYASPEIVTGADLKIIDETLGGTSCPR
jgi:hypothetical protein